MITTACCTPDASASATAVVTPGVGSAGGGGQGAVSSTTGLPVPSPGARTPPLIFSCAVSPAGTVTVAAAETAPDAGASVVDAVAPMTTATAAMVSNDASITSLRRWPRLIGWPTSSPPPSSQGAANNHLPQPARRPTIRRQVTTAVRSSLQNDWSVPALNRQDR